ncbi:uncharacterized protein LOC119734513 [Patiria miniata]|uniref:DDE Tnp4 domain-containing protein n=1 Tax=Patiria miniata TaxID=46514 RepID=A0A914AJ12_PATMI|nr:uncharacterized protein LOC119734513 [Patiria miniata]
MKTVERATINEQYFKDDDKVKFYTGLPTHTVLMAVFNFVLPKIPVRKILTPFQQLVLVLLKLKLNLKHKDLAFRFQVSEATVCRIFSLMLDILSTQLSPLIMWPSRETLWKTMPMDFRQAFGKHVAVIIDCFEVFCVRPSSVEARAQTWSNYKHHNTVKFLIGITPSGIISYLSSAWGGRGSDKAITLQSDFLYKLLPGDYVLADRGFNISDEVGFYCAQLLTPAFSKGKPQLSVLDVERSRKIAHLRIHVERVIGELRETYSILSEKVPWESLVTSEK